MHTDEEDDQIEISKSQRKRDAADITELGEHLASLAESQLSQLDLSPQIRDAIAELKGIRAFGARKRQKQYLGKLLRNTDVEPIHRWLAQQQQQKQAAVAIDHEAENWRERLINEGDQALGEFLEHHENLDRQKLRQLTRNAQAERKQEKPPRFSRELFRELRSALLSKQQERQQTDLPTSQSSTQPDATPPAGGDHADET